MKNCIATLVLCAITIAANAATAEQPSAVRLVGHFTLSTGLKLAGVEFGGISGLDYDVAAKRFIAISDDRAERGPARFYEFAMELDQRGIASLEVLAAIPLTDPDGKAYGTGTVDPEEIHLLPSGNLVWADEGGAPGKGSGPGLIEATRAGRTVGVLPLPDYYRPTADKNMGVRNNLGHESIAVRPDGTELLAFTECALAQDGPIATLERGSPARVLAFDLATRRARAEYIYFTEAIPTASTRQPPVQDNGVSSATYLRDGRLIVMERSFAAGVGNTIQIFEVEIADATNVLGRVSLADAADVKPLRKKRLGILKPGDADLPLDNMEAITQGPDIDGKPTLVLFSDNNFNRHQANVIVLLQMTHYKDPSTQVRRSAVEP